MPVIQLGCISLPPWQFLAFYPNTALGVLWLGIDQWLCAGSLSEPSNYRKSDKNSCDRGQVSSKILRTRAELSYLAVPGWFRQSVSVLTSQPRALHCYYYYCCCCTPPVHDKALHCVEPWEKHHSPHSNRHLSHESSLVYIKTAGSCRVLWGNYSAFTQGFDASSKERRKVLLKFFKTQQQSTQDGLTVA